METQPILRANIKVPIRNFSAGYETSKFNPDASHLTQSVNETIGEETGDYYPVFYDAFSWSTQSAEMLQNALRCTDRKRRFVVYEPVRSAVLFVTIYGWRQEDIFL